MPKEYEASAPVIDLSSKFLQEWENVSAITSVLQKYFYLYSYERPRHSL